MDRMLRRAGIRSVLPIRRSTILVLLLVLLMVIVGNVWWAGPWAVRSETFDFTDLQRTDAITIRIQNRDVRTITDADSIRAITGFARSHQDRWSVPWSGVPVGRVQIEFFSQGGFVGDLGVGRGFFTTQQRGGFYSRPVTTNDQDQILSLLDLTPQDLG